MPDVVEVVAPAFDAAALDARDQALLLHVAERLFDLVLAQVHERVAIGLLIAAGGEGVEAEGTRTTETIPAGEIGNEQPIQIVSERWYSPELQVVVMSKHSDPFVGETIYRLTNIVRGEPSRALFEVPVDYTLKESPVQTRIFRKRSGDEKFQGTGETLRACAFEPRGARRERASIAPVDDDQRQGPEARESTRFFTLEELTSPGTPGSR